MLIARMHRLGDNIPKTGLVELDALTSEESILAHPINSTLCLRDNESDIWDAIIRIRRRNDKFIVHRMFVGAVKELIFVGDKESALLAACDFVEETRARNTKYKDKLPGIPLDYQWVKVKHDKDM